MRYRSLALLQSDGHWLGLRRALLLAGRCPTLVGRYGSLALPQGHMRVRTRHDPELLGFVELFEVSSKFSHLDASSCGVSIGFC